VQDAVEHPFRPHGGVVVVPEFPGEHIDSMLRRFKKVAQKAGVITDWRRHESFMSKPERLRLKRAVAQRRRNKAGL
jgi:ribosomal protein S21